MYYSHIDNSSIAICISILALLVSAFGLWINWQDKLPKLKVTVSGDEVVYEDEIETNGNFYNVGQILEIIFIDLYNPRGKRIKVNNIEFEWGTKLRFLVIKKNKVLFPIMDPQKQLPFWIAPHDKEPISFIRGDLLDELEIRIKRNRNLALRVIVTSASGKNYYSNWLVIKYTKSPL